MGKSRNNGFNGNVESFGKKSRDNYKRQCSKKSNIVYAEITKKKINPDDIPQYIRDIYNSTKEE